MNKEMIKKAVASKVVDFAVGNSNSSSCTFFFGKPRERFELTLDDYIELATFIKRSQS